MSDINSGDLLEISNAIYRLTKVTNKRLKKLEVRLGSIACSTAKIKEQLHKQYEESNINKHDE